jgi:hypothetical protein
MKDTMEIGSSPVSEDCAQVGASDYYERAQKECRAFVNQLKRAFGNPPEGARLTVKSFPHDFGTYYEVVVAYDDSNEKAVDYAFNLEGNTPEYWDDEAKEELQSEAPPEREAPSDDEIEAWFMDGMAEATDGCSVEVDGICPHGKESWLRHLGMV